MDIEKILRKELGIAGGPLPVKGDGTFELRNLKRTLDPKKENLIVHIEYLPKKDRYCFEIYRVREINKVN